IGPPGTVIPFKVKVAGVNDPNLMDMQQVMFTLPAVHGVTATAIPAKVSTTPGTPVQATLQLQATGNVPENITFQAGVSGGLTLSGLSQLTLNPGDTANQTITLTPAAETALNTTLAATIDVHFGAALPETIRIPVHVAVPGADAIADAANAANQLG